MSDIDDNITVQSITSPGRTERVNRAKYMAMREALIAVLPSSAPGITVAEAKESLLAHLLDNLFPAGATAGWWLKCVQLDLEAKGIVVRETSKPLRLHRAK